MLIDQARREAIEGMMSLHGNALLRMCFLHLRDEQLAQDAVQETFLKAWRRLDAFRGECSESTWLTKIAINVCRDMLRTGWLRRVDRSVDIGVLPECAQADQYPDSTVLTQVMNLPARQREVILLRYYREMTLQETAVALGFPARGAVTPLPISISGRKNRVFVLACQGREPIFTKNGCSE